MRPTRRKMLLGMGALATGSGALFSNAAFSTSTTSAADLRVLVEERGLVFRGNPDAPDDEDNIVDTDDFENFFDGEDIDDSNEGAFDGETTPLAATNGEANENLEISAVAGLGESATFSDLFILENNTGESVNVGIAYNRDDNSFNTTGSTAGQYGEDILGGGLSPSISRASYRFVVNRDVDGNGVSESDFFGGYEDGLISPAQNGDLPNGGNLSPSENNDASGGSVANYAEGANETISNYADRPASAITVAAGEAVTVDLVVDIDYDQPQLNAIQEQADISSSNGFSVQRDTVDLLDGITVGTLEEPSS